MARRAAGAGESVRVTYMSLAEAFELPPRDPATAALAILFFDHGQPVPEDVGASFGGCLVVRANDLDRRRLNAAVRSAASCNHLPIVGGIAGRFIGDHRGGTRRWRPFTMADARRIRAQVSVLADGERVVVACRHGRSRSRTTATVIAEACGAVLERAPGKPNAWIAQCLERAYRVAGRSG